MESLGRDLRHALRAMRRAPGLFAAAILTLATGAGLATGVIAVAYGVLLRPLPYPGAARLASMAIHPIDMPDRDGGLRLAEFEEWWTRLRVLDGMAAYSAAELTVRGAGEPRSVRTALVTPSFFDVLAMPAAQGSTAALKDGAAAVVVSGRLAAQLGKGEWRVRGLTIGTGSFAVAAIMPAEFSEPADDVDLWVRADAVPGVRLYGTQDLRSFRLIGRLAPGVSFEQATEDLRRVAREIDGAKEPGRRRHGTARPLREHARNEAWPTVVPFLAGSLLVLLIACANVSGLLVGRAVAREREFAVRRALGASAFEVMRASLVESFVAALAGSALGLLVAYVVTRLFASVAAGALPNLHGIRIDVPIVLASLALTMAVAFLSGAAPALRAVRADPHAALKASPERTGRARGVLRNALVVSQIALTVVLLVSAGLLMRTVHRLGSLERGYDASGALAMRLRLTQDVRFEVNERAPFIDRLLTEVRALPGVRAAGVGSDLPPNRTQMEMTIRVINDRRDETFALSPSAVTPGYLEALGVAVVSGRLFEERDRVADVPPVVLSEEAARQLFDGRDPVGQLWPAPLPGPAGRRVKPMVIGVVRDIKHKGLDRDAPAVLFAPWERLAPSNAHLVVRAAGSPGHLAAALRRIVQELDPTLPIFPPQTLEQVLADSIADRRLRLRLAETFGALALALAVVALWGAMAQSVLDRRRELAVRLALGSSGAAAIRLLLRAGFAMIALGLGLGALGAAVVSRALQHLLHGITPLDPPAFLAASALAAAVAGLGCYLPARRAAAISPSELLREN